MLIDLRDKLNLCINDNPMRELIVRQRKNNLVNSNYKDVIAAVNEINTSESVYVKKTLIPLLQDSLQQKNIESIISIIQNAYSSKLGKDKFTEKKLAIKEKLHDLYDKKIFDNRLMFGLGMALYRNPSNKQFAAGTFRSDLKKWMYTGERVHESFWNVVVGADSKETVEENAGQELSSTLTK